MLIPPPEKLRAMIRCAERELRFRNRGYARLIESGKLSQGEAEHEIETMQDILNHFLALEVHGGQINTHPAMGVVEKRG